MPQTQSVEKIEMLRLCGAEVRLVPARPYRDPGNYVRGLRTGGRRARPRPSPRAWSGPTSGTTRRTGAATTRPRGPEIWRQTGGRIDGFICAIGTGGTLAGTGKALKERNPDVVVGLADPDGAAMYSYFKTGELASEGSSITEGIGQGRVTGNVAEAVVDAPFRVPDTEALPVIFDLLRRDGLCLGGSSGINVAGAVRLARELGPGHTVVTVLADGGQRYASKLFNPAFLRDRGLPAPDWL